MCLQHDSVVHELFSGHFCCEHIVLPALAYVKTRQMIWDVGSKPHWSTVVALRRASLESHDGHSAGLVPQMQLRYLVSGGPMSMDEQTTFYGTLATSC